MGYTVECHELQSLSNRQTNVCLLADKQKVSFIPKLIALVQEGKKIKCNPRLYEAGSQKAINRTTETYAEKTTKARIKTDCFYT